MSVIDPSSSQPSEEVFGPATVGKCKQYFVVNRLKKWTNANTVCQLVLGEGASLANVQSRNDQSAVQSFGSQFPEVWTVGSFNSEFSQNVEWDDGAARDFRLSVSGTFGDVCGGGRGDCDVVVVVFLRRVCTSHTMFLLSL
jgi:hypothetical protein